MVRGGNIGPSETSSYGPAFYAQPSLVRSPRLRQWWTMLHPPYTLLNSSLVVVGACLAGPVNFARLAITLLAFFLAVGVGAHCLDELHGRPLGTTISSRQLKLGAMVGVGGAVGLGIAGLFVVSGYLAIFMVLGVVAVVGYNLELFHARLHNDVVLVTSWGTLTIVTSYFAQHATVSLSSLVVGAFGALVVLLQRTLSTPARLLRRRVRAVEGRLVLRDDSTKELTTELMLAPLERSLRLLCWSGELLALGMLIMRVVGR